MFESNGTSKVTDDLRSLLYQVERYLRLEAVDKLTVVTTCMILAAVTFAIATSAIFFLSTGLVKTLTLATENEMVSYYIVGGGLVLIIILFYLLRKPLVENNMVRVLSKSLLEGQSLTNSLAAKADKAEKIHKLAESLAKELDDYEEEGGKEA
ncbi:MAG: hypothetical protein KBT29_10115 [Prevotellaceae bacterium]|nr:hypothetical protein [Candidatus Minthosoma caballi]